MAMMMRGMGGGMRPGSFKGQGVPPQQRIWALAGISATGHDGPPMFTVPRGRTVVLNYINRTAFAHAMHTHGHHFRAVRRQRRRLQALLARYRDRRRRPFGAHRLRRRQSRQVDDALSHDRAHGRRHGGLVPGRQRGLNVSDRDRQTAAGKHARQCFRQVLRDQTGAEGCAPPRRAARPRHWPLRRPACLAPSARQSCRPAHRRHRRWRA